MKKLPEPVLISPKTSKDYFPQILYGAVVPEHLLNADWWEPAFRGYPNLKLSFDSRSVTDWLLYRQIEALGEAVQAHFSIAAHWAVRKALGENFERARQMDAYSDETRHRFQSNVGHCFQRKPCHLFRLNPGQSFHPKIGHRFRWLAADRGGGDFSDF